MFNILKDVMDLQKKSLKRYSTVNAVNTLAQLVKGRLNLKVKYNTFYWHDRLDRRMSVID